jgi:hypothetical protein
MVARYNSSGACDLLENKKVTVFDTIDCKKCAYNLASLMLVMHTVLLDFREEQCMSYT